MEIHALFEDQTASRLVFAFFAPSPSDDPVRVACIGIQDQGVVHSAQVGCLAAYHLLAQQRLVDPGARFFPSCQFGDAQANLRARGGSAGLAFSLKFAAEALKLSPRPGRPAAVAATGVVENGGHDAGVGRVERIENKVQAALQVLGQGDLLVIPQANAAEVSAELRLALQEKGILLQTAATVAEALALLIPPPRRRRQWKRSACGSWVVVPLLALVLGVWWWRAQEVPGPLALADGGEFLEASARALERLERAPGEEEALSIHRQLAEPLGLRAGLWVLDAGITGLQPRKVELGPGLSEVPLRAGDLCRFYWQTADSCFLHLVKVGPGGEMVRLSAERARARAGQRYFLPADAQEWYRVEQADLGGRYVFVAARRPGEDLEALWRNHQALAGKQREEVGREIRARLDRRHQAQGSGLEGVFFAEIPLGSTLSVR
jgi:hypothetical protein